MAKRGASNQLTDRNWDQEEEPEEAGLFIKASDEEMKSRKIIRAKRKNIGEDSKPAAFSGFGGFSFKPTQTSTPLMGLGGFKSESKITGGTEVKIASDKSNGSDKGVKGANKSSDSEYLQNLKALNKSVLDWISTHVAKNPYCILTPIFKDYETHLTRLEDLKSKTNTNGTATTTNTDESKEADPPEAANEEKPAAPKTGLTFAIGGLSTVGSVGGTTDSKPPAFPGFSFKPSSDATGTGGFSFAVGSSTGGFSFATGASTSSGTGGEADEEYVPPKVETIEHKEEGSLYSKKCKLFYQNEGAWVEKGVGYLHLKKNNDKAQLLVRADTSLGNILLNIHLSAAVPLSRQGKNNVSMVCVMNPPVPKMPENKPVPMLIRVKTGDDADELLAKMKEVRS